jgi:hypothetical protein
VYPSKRTFGAQAVRQILPSRSRDHVG